MKRDCGCCEGIEVLTPERVANRPGLPAIAHRVGTYATFLETMLARLSSLTITVPQAQASDAPSQDLRPLAELTTRAAADASIALLDAWAVLADVLTFYQERIANDAYLPTAGERRSIVELAKLIGHRPRQGVAASVFLAFNAIKDFDGTIPLGTRAQSVPGTGETAQFFETSVDLRARDEWNLLSPRIKRPQVITPPATQVIQERTVPVVTGADVLDCLYFRGMTTQLKSGDALVFVFGGGLDQQFLRHVESVNPQAADERTEITLVPILPTGSGNASSLLSPFVDKASYLFPGSELAQEIADVVSTLLVNVGIARNDTQAAGLIRGAMPQVREKRDIAVGRNFSRVTAWADHLLRTLEALARFADDNHLDGAGSNEGSEPFRLLRSSLPASPLGKLAAIVDKLAQSASLQPANASRLARSVAQSFEPQSDTAPRLLQALRPQAARKLYRAWTRVEVPAHRVEVHAARVKASLFAHNFPGIPKVSSGSTTLTAPTLQSAWRLDSQNAPSAPFVALDAAYEQIKPGSWLVIDTPELPAFAGAAAGGVPAGRTYHRVVAAKTATLDAGDNTNFAAKVSLLTVDPPWLGDLKAELRRQFLASTAGLRSTVVYVQTEQLDLADEPLDTDIQGDSIELARVYDGLESGRWIIVAGERTDVPNVTGVTDHELVMIAGVAQGARPPLSVGFPLAGTPFVEVLYTTGANAFGDRLVVGRLAPALRPKTAGGIASDVNISALTSLPLPTVANQQYRDQVQLAPGLYANAYVPTQNERQGHFPEFAGLLVDPATGEPYSDGRIFGQMAEEGLFAWRISSQPLHTVIRLANALAYKYDTRSIRIYGNVVNATQGQSIGEVLGDGDGSRRFQRFALRQAPLTYVSAPTAAGAQSTLSVRVNEIRWREAQSSAGLGPGEREFVTEVDDEDRVQVIFGDGEHGGRVPTGKSNVKATYRYGIGKAGNVRGGQISQLATQPLGVQGVVNPLPATGGADRDSADEIRHNAPLSTLALDRLVSVQDYESFARSYAGIAKASAVRLSDGRQQLVHLTIAGKDDIPIDRTSDLYRNLRASLELYGEQNLPIGLAVRRTKLLVISAGVRLLPDYLWEAVEPALRAAVLAAFRFDRRALGQPAFLSEAIAAMQGLAGVDYVDVDCFDSVAEDVTAAELASLGSTLTLKPYTAAELAALGAGAAPGADLYERVTPAELVYMTTGLPETLTLKLIQ